MQCKFCLHWAWDSNENISLWSGVRLYDLCSVYWCWADEVSITESCVGCWANPTPRMHFCLFVFVHLFLILTERTDEFAVSLDEAIIPLFLGDQKPIWTAHNYNHLSNIIICQWNEHTSSSITLLQHIDHVPWCNNDL